MAAGGDSLRCRLCGAALPTPALITLDRVPRGAQAFLKPAQIRMDAPVSLTVRACSACGLVQAVCPPVANWRNVVRSGGYSAEMRNLRRRQFRRFLASIPRKGGRVLEVGAAKGDLLEILLETGATASGIEASRAAVTEARSKGLPIEQAYPAAGQPLPGGPFDAFLSVNVLEHAIDPRDFLIGIRESLAEDAVGLVEVPSFERMLDQRRFYDFIADHLSYFTSETLRLALEMSGFDVLRVSKDWWVDDIVAFVRVRRRRDLGGTQADLDQATAAVRDFVGVFTRRGQRVAVWGASHQALTLLALADARDVAFIIDSAPFKQGRLTPATHLPIVAPDWAVREQPAAVLVMAAGYSDEVLRTLMEAMHYGGVIGVLRGNGVELVQSPGAS